MGLIPWPAATDGMHGGAVRPLATGPRRWPIEASDPRAAGAVHLLPASGTSNLTPAPRSARPMRFLDASPSDHGAEGYARWIDVAGRHRSSPPHAAAGFFYGVQTLLQFLATPAAADRRLGRSPCVRIADRPRLPRGGG